MGLLGRFLFLSIVALWTVDGVSFAACRGMYDAVSMRP